MPGRPAVEGAVQLTVRLSSVTFVKVGAAGESGGSSVSVTSIATSMVSAAPRASRTVTVTAWLDCASWSRGALARSCPLAASSMSNDAASTPERL